MWFRKINHFKTFGLKFHIIKKKKRKKSKLDQEITRVNEMQVLTKNLVAFTPVSMICQIIIMHNVKLLDSVTWLNFTNYTCLNCRDLWNQSSCE